MVLFLVLDSRIKEETSQESLPFDPLGRFNSEEVSLPYPDVHNTVFSSPPHLCYTYFSLYTLPWGQGLPIFGLAVLVIH